MAGEGTERKIPWYRSLVEREALAALNQRSDWQGSLQTFGYFGLILLTGASAWYCANSGLWALFGLILFIHGSFFAFLLNAFHEFCHKSVFKTRFLNIIFLDVVSFLCWSNPIQFWTSHQEHHKFTLHPPDDLEVTLPVKLPVTAFLKIAVVGPWDFYARLKSYVRLSFGQLEGEWEKHLFRLRKRLYAGSCSIGRASSSSDRR